MPKHDIHTPSCFLALPIQPLGTNTVLRNALREGIQRASYRLISIDEAIVTPGSTIQNTIIGALAQSECMIADISDRNPNVYFELGLAQAMGKGIVLISDEQLAKDVPLDIQGLMIISYSTNPKSMKNLTSMIQRSLEEFRKFPRNPVYNIQSSLPFFINWEMLSTREFENLCLELLSQLGFRKLNWGKSIKEVDLIAELPRKDPDGFEFHELWLVSMGMHMPVKMLFTLALEPMYLVHRLTRYSEDLEDKFLRNQDTPITLLAILLDKRYDHEEIEKLQERFERRRMKQEPYSSNIRFRIWDQNYLTSLVQRFSHLGYKYFSEEGRIRSKTRKSYEELYNENSTLSQRLVRIVSELEAEKNRRVRAERDAVWKDISFTAAHRIGNPIFAIETDLDPLSKRIKEDRKNEAEVVLSNIRSSVEKAKAFIEQFKSLAKAQEIKPVACNLKLIIEDACQALSHHEHITCNIDCAEDLKIFGDPERLGECLDELLINATHWFNKPEKVIQINVNSSPEPIPDFLDSSQQYVLIHVIDNGCGVEVPLKNKIFDAFFTKYDHGTGLGLSLVRRIIDGHGGGIFETGTPGKGADFEIYLPLSSETKIGPTVKSISRKAKEK